MKNAVTSAGGGIAGMLPPAETQRLSKSLSAVFDCTRRGLRKARVQLAVSTEARRESEQLRQAFDVFEHAARDLEASYAMLRGRVEELSAQLAQANAELRRKERLATMGEMAARFAHQLRTPLATAMLYADRIERGRLDHMQQADVGSRLIARLRSLERVTREMLQFAAGERAPEKPVAVGELLAESADVVAPIMAARGIAFHCEDLTGGAVVHGDRRGLAAALLSLLENAAQATPQGGKVRIDGMANSMRVRIRVSDSGGGIAPEALPRLFEPFYSTRADGTGLGLAIVKSVVEAHGGSVDVESCAEAGTCFTVVLPCSRQAPGTALVAQAHEGAMSGTRESHSLTASSARRIETRSPTALSGLCDESSEAA